MSAPVSKHLVSLQIGAHQTTVTLSSGERTLGQMTLMAGSQRTARDHFRHVPPSLLDIENAIMAVEDEVMRVRPMLTVDSGLQTSDEAIHTLARLTGVADNTPTVLTLDAVEHLFGLLAAWIQGRPASSAGIPADPGLAATVLILREFMHHLSFASITLTTPAMPAAGPLTSPSRLTEDGASDSGMNLH